uniref:Uncharacterized protein n=1 Tax=Oryza meridionalis TaxID=40149 RepID=A0A0E0E764_9ORYZ
MAYGRAAREKREVRAALAALRGRWWHEELTRDRPVTADCGGGKGRRAKRGFSSGRRGVDSPELGLLQGFKNSFHRSRKAERHREWLTMRGGLRDRAGARGELWRAAAGAAHRAAEEGVWWRAHRQERSSVGSADVVTAAGRRSTERAWPGKKRGGGVVEAARWR